jgi:hypothetical protein
MDSLLAWGDRRTADLPPVDSIEWKRLAAALDGLKREKYSLGIIDTWGIDGAATTEAMRAADLTLIPARPSAIDVMANKPTVAALIRLDRPLCSHSQCLHPRMDGSRSRSLQSPIAAWPISPTAHCSSHRSHGRGSCWPGRD